MFSFLLGFIFNLNVVHSQNLTIECSTSAFNVNSCSSNSLNVLTNQTTFAGLGPIVKIDALVLNNDESVSVQIANKENTNTYTLFANINNRGRLNDLSIDLKSQYNQLTAFPFMSIAPKTSSGLVLTDVVENLILDVSGHIGKRGRNLSELCRDKIKDGYYGPLYLNENKKLYDDFVSSGRNICTKETLTLIGLDAPNQGCPEGFSYLSGRDNLSSPELQGSERPLRLPFLKKCLEEKIFRSCRAYTSLIEQTYQELGETTLTCDELYQMKVQEGLIEPDLTVIEYKTSLRDIISHENNDRMLCSDNKILIGYSQDYDVYRKCEEESPNGYNTNYYLGYENTCPKATERFDSLVIFNEFDDIPYESLELEALPCIFGNCPGVKDFYAHKTEEINKLALESGETGSLGGKIDLFSYDISNIKSLKFQNGKNGSMGIADLDTTPIIKYCYKKIDASNTNDFSFLKSPQVNFYQIEFYPISYSLPEKLSYSNLPLRNLNEAIHIYKKIDSSVRYFMSEEYIETKFP